MRHRRQKEGKSPRWNSMCKLMVCTECEGKWTDSGKSATKMLHLIRASDVMTAVLHRSK